MSIWSVTPSLWEYGSVLEVGEEPKTEAIYHVTISSYVPATNSAALLR
jgi:hypothetical protein